MAIGDILHNERAEMTDPYTGRPVIRLTCGGREIKTLRLPVANPPEMISMTVDWKKEYAGDIVMEGKEAQTE